MAIGDEMTLLTAPEALHGIQLLGTLAVTFRPLGRPLGTRATILGTLAATLGRPRRCATLGRPLRWLNCFCTGSLTANAILRKHRPWMHKASHLILRRLPKALLGWTKQGVVQVARTPHQLVRLCDGRCLTNARIHDAHFKAIHTCNMPRY